VSPPLDRGLEGINAHCTGLDPVTAWRGSKADQMSESRWEDQRGPWEGLRGP